MVLYPQSETPGVVFHLVNDHVKRRNEHDSAPPPKDQTNLRDEQKWGDCIIPRPSNPQKTHNGRLFHLTLFAGIQCYGLGTISPWLVSFPAPLWLVSYIIHGLWPRSLFMFQWLSLFGREWLSIKGIVQNSIYEAHSWGFDDLEQVRAIWIIEILHQYLYPYGPLLARLPKHFLVISCDILLIWFDIICSLSYFHIFSNITMPCSQSPTRLLMVSAWDAVCPIFLRGSCKYWSSDIFGLLPSRLASNTCLVVFCKSW